MNANLTVAAKSCFGKILLVGIAALAVSASALLAQSNTVPSAPVISPLISDTTPVLSLLTNIPTVSFQAETFGVSVGTVMHGTSTFENSLAFEYVVHTNFAFAAEVQSGTGSSVVDSAGAYFKLRKAGLNYEIYALMGGRRNWDTANFEGVAGFGAAYKMTSSVACFAEQRLVTSFNTHQPATETLLGIKLCF